MHHLKYLWENKKGIEEHGLTLDEKTLGSSFSVGVLKTFVLFLVGIDFSDDGWPRTKGFYSLCTLFSPKKIQCYIHDTWWLSLSMQLEFAPDKI